MSVPADDIGLEYAGALGARWVVFVKDTDDVAPGPMMMFSAYGVSPGVRVAVRERGLQVIDATCPPLRRCTTK
jgi:4-hydroxy-3-methylbut-2-en-1-yl diphosphate reductase